MKSSVGSLLLGLCLASSPFASESGPKCTCQPSPPGGVTECQAGQIASCNGKGGVCRGRCFGVNAQLSPLQYSAELLKAATGEEEVTEASLKKDPKASKKLLEQVVKLSDQGKSGEIKVMGRKHYIGIGLSDVAKGKLKAAIKALAGMIPLHINVPPIFRP